MNEASGVDDGPLLDRAVKERKERERQNDKATQS